MNSKTVFQYVHHENPSISICVLFRSPSMPTTPTASHSTTYLINTPEQLSMFSIDKFEDRLRQHIEERFSVKMVVKKTGDSAKASADRARITFQVSGQMQHAESAIDDLTELFCSLRTRTFTDQKGKTRFSPWKSAGSTSRRPVDNHRRRYSDH